MHKIKHVLNICLTFLSETFDLLFYHTGIKMKKNPNILFPNKIPSQIWGIKKCNITQCYLCVYYLIWSEGLNDLHELCWLCL